MLQDAESASNGTTLYYDPLGRLVEYDTTVSARIVYDGGAITQQVANPAGNTLRRYVLGANPDEILVWYEGAGTTDRRFAHADERGSVVAWSDSAGNALAINRYDEYGIPSPSNLGSFEYTGQIWLFELGLYYYKARMYSATLGRFLQTDPIGYDDGPNWYNYVGGDPVNGSDPSGTKTTTKPKPTPPPPPPSPPPPGPDIVVNGELPDPPPPPPPPPPDPFLNILGNVVPAGAIPINFPDDFFESGNKPKRKPKPPKKPPSYWCRVGGSLISSGDVIGRGSFYLVIGGSISNPASPELLILGGAGGLTSGGFIEAGHFITSIACKG